VFVTSLIWGSPMRKKILCFGEVAWDRAWLLSQLPRPGHDSDILAEYESPGGCALNSAYMLASCHVPVILAGNYVGSDLRGQALREYLARAGVENHVVSRSEKPTPLNQCLVAQSSGERTFILSHDGIQDYSPTLIGQILDDLSSGVFSHIFVQPYIHEGTKHLLPYIPKSTWILAQEIDCNSEFLPSIDALQLSLDEGTVFLASTITQLASTFFRGRLREIFFTHGAHGVWYQRKDSLPRFFPAVPVDKVVDTTGCGDAFRAGLMFSLFSGATTVEAILVGLKFGALKAQTRGSHCKGLCESQTDG
jgi:sugar/nucleoside kinase (ribokinase family)